MKLIYCPACHDVRTLYTDLHVICKCGLSWGEYHIDGLHADYGGRAIPLGFDKPSLLAAIRCREISDQKVARVFRAFVIERNCETFKQVGNPPDQA